MPFKVALAGLLLTACGTAFTSEPGADASADAVLEHATDDTGDALEHPETAPSADVELPDALPGNDAGNDSDARDHDAGDVVDARDAVSEPPVDAGDEQEASPCPPVGCLCVSEGPVCPASLPYVCSGGLECCNWRPPTC
jgi:hypothetical protein